MRTSARSALISAPAAGFPRGLSWIARTEAKDASRRMDFGLCRPRPGRPFPLVSSRETLWILLRGRAELSFQDRKVLVERESVFSAGPSVLNLGPGEAATLRPLDRHNEWAVVAAMNPKFRGRAHLYLPRDIRIENRGEGLAQGACQRCVRTIYDYTTRRDSAFVLGEVVNLPGRWSSYPPHHHPQAEIYHYRCTAPAGYGHAEVGEQVFKVRTGDTTVIPGGLDHAQVSAPGFGLYYLWVIRHLPGQPYRGFKVTPAYRDLLNPKNQGWRPPATLFT